MDTAACLAGRRGTGALLACVHPGGGMGGGVSPGLAEGFRADAARWCWALQSLPQGAPPAGRRHAAGLGEGGQLVAPGKCSPHAPERSSVPVLGCAACLAASGGGVPGAALEGPGPGLVIRGCGGAPTTVWFPCVSRGGYLCGSLLPGPRGTGAAASVRGHSLGGCSAPGRASAWGGGAHQVGLACLTPPDARLPVAGGPLLGAAWRSRAHGAAQGVSGRRVSLCRPWAPLSSVPLPRVPAPAMVRYGQVQASLPRMPWFLGSVPAGGAPRVAGPCHPPLVGIRGSAHWVPGHRLDFRPQYPLPPAWPLLRRVVPRGGGAGGRLGVPYVATPCCHPCSLGGPGVRGRWGRRPGSVVSGSEGDSIAVHARSSRAAAVRLPGGTPTRVPAAVVAPQDQGSRLPPPCPCAKTAGGSGVPRLGGP